MTEVACAIVAGVGFYIWIREVPAWPAAIGMIFGLVQHSPTMITVGVGVGLGFALYLQAAAFENQRDHDEQTAMLFLVRLRQLLGVTGTLGGALDEMGYRSLSVGSDAAEQLVSRLSQDLRVGVLSFLGRVALLVRRHGGSLVPVVDWAADGIQKSQSLRHARQLEEAVQRSTIVVLAVAPGGVLFIFRFIVPSFYRIILTTGIGHFAILMIGAVTFGVLMILSQHIRKEAEVR